MPNIYTLPLMLFVLFAAVYIVGCLFLYIYLYKNSRKKPKSKKAQQKSRYLTIGIVFLTLFTSFLMSKWIVMQMMNGCVQTFFWNPHCYDLNSLCRPWLIICGLIGINAVVVSALFDLHTQAKRVHKK